MIYARVSMRTFGTFCFIFFFLPFSSRSSLFFVWLHTLNLHVHVHAHVPGTCFIMGLANFCSMLVGPVFVFFFFFVFPVTDSEFNFCCFSFCCVHCTLLCKFIHFVIVSLSWGSFTPCVCANRREMYCYAFTAGGNDS